MGLVDGLGVRLPLLVLGDRPVDAGRARGVSLAFAGGDDQVWADRLDGFAAGAPPEHGVQHVVGDDRRSSAVAPFAGGGVEPLEGGLADVLASVSAIAAKRRLGSTEDTTTTEDNALRATPALGPVDGRWGGGLIPPATGRDTPSSSAVFPVTVRHARIGC